MTMPRKNKGFIFLSLSLLALIPALLMDGYAPSLLYIKKYFQLNNNEIQLTFSTLVFTLGFGQLIFGSLSDCYGRRFTAFLAITLFIISSFLYIHAKSYKAFFLSRFMQGFGAAGMTVLAFAIVRDIYTNTDNHISKIYGYLAAICALSPILVPWLVGHLSYQFGWQATGYLFLIPAICAGLAICFIPETLPKKKRVKFNLIFLINYKNILLNKLFLFYSLISAIGLAIAFIFSSISIYILVDLAKIPPRSYDIYYSCYGIIYMLGNFTAACIVKKMGTNRVILCGLLIGAAGAAWMLIWNYFYMLSPFSFYVPMMLSIIGSTFCQIAGLGGAIKELKIHYAGRAVALNSAIRFIFISCVGMLVIKKDIQSVFPVAVSILLLSILGMMIFFLIKKYHHSTTA
jgi:Bcr/CflA subfamily drug resistance transporter